MASSSKTGLSRTEPTRSIVGCTNLGVQGQSMVELALLLPLLLLMLLVAFNLGTAFYSTVTVVAAAHNGALYGSGGSSLAADSQAIRQVVLADAVNLGGTPPTVTSTVSADPYGDQVLAVSVAYVYSVPVPFPGVPASYTLSSTAQMRVKP